MEPKIEQQKVTFVYPKTVLESMRHLAKAHQRSLIGEIVWALRQYIAQEGVEHGHDANDHAQDPAEPDA